MEKYTKPERKPPAKLLLSRKLNFMKTKKAFRLLRSERSRSCGCSYMILMWLKVRFMLQFDYILVLKLCFVKQIHLAWGLSCYLYVRYCIYYFSRSNMDRILLESWRRCPIERCMSITVAC
ncbi:hypothetical protein HanRHA438_Chr15g0722061 [Helianthus annuus]|nr:hypothetical protein HanHA300_Chr15g0578801 [Helianthus annuus]KAJ0457303.1 hypothetical protein HanIR_Chr15g0772151 [Helianthus annuus]KAJ0649892.1 hypothetical protein HanLR1_Chr15g0589421 [Helianthus annuus]KAJ0653677.1 hypothetical protein HanOQP8_Chr15g0586211 [Helianthus annuus]KAJ0846191.1 hypothetical protein HanRHA438_Chr15g0722061 [Helianthus annuus]